MCPMQHHAVQNPSRFLPAANQHLPPVPTTPHHTLPHTHCARIAFYWHPAAQGKAASLPCCCLRGLISRTCYHRGVCTSQALSSPIHGLQAARQPATFGIYWRAHRRSCRFTALRHKLKAAPAYWCTSLLSRFSWMKGRTQATLSLHQTLNGCGQR